MRSNYYRSDEFLLSNYEIDKLCLFLHDVILCNQAEIAILIMVVINAI